MPTRASAWRRCVGSSLPGCLAYLGARDTGRGRAAAEAIGACFVQLDVTSGDAVRRATKGHAITDGEVDADAVGISAPVFSAPDDVIAGLSVVLLRSRVTEDEKHAIADTLMASARKLTDEVALLAG